MEALSGAASGIAVVSLAIQLIQSVALIREFIKDVKGASKELHRLVGKLELLNALLENVQKVLEQQSSLSGTHFPAPSMAVFNCLQGCEDSIQPLVNIVKKLSLPQSQSGSSTARLKSEIKLGLKTKEIATLETRIQHDIDLLTNSLSINQSGILLGVYRRKVTRYQDQRIQDLKGNVKTYTRDILSTAEEISALLAFSGFGLTFTQQYPYGGIFPSLKTYPVGRLSGEIREIIRCGSVQQFQEEVSSGAVHPFMREVNGWSLLHHAAFHHRSDICRLLLGYGVKPELSLYDQSPLSIALNIHQPYWSFATPTPANSIDTYRCFLDYVDLFHELKRLDVKWWSLACFKGEEAQWLWQKSLELFIGADLRSNQRVIIRRSWSSVAKGDHPLWHKSQFPVFLMDRDILSDIQYGRCRIIEGMFLSWWDSMFSYIAGARFLDWLVSLGLDPELCVASELADSVKISGHFDKRIVFERNWEHKWVLGFEWVFDHEAPGYLLFSEYTVIVVETISYHNEWPFCEWVHETERKRDDRSAHFSRRMAAKERKERARLGQKQPRSRMPGAWKW
ncbi:unnamed protein product [Alternaria alternata]